MSHTTDRPPPPRRRLLRTLLKRPRNLARFASPIAAGEILSVRPEAAVAAHWGQAILLHDSVLALHRDGTMSHRQHLVTMLSGDAELAAWDELGRTYDSRTSRHAIHRAVVHLPDGSHRDAERTAAALDAHSRVISLTFQPLRPGVIVELEEQYDQFVPGEVGPGVWDQVFLQRPAPLGRMRFTAAIAGPFALHVRLHHTDAAPTETTLGEYRIHQWDLRDRPPLETDDWTPHPRDFAPWIDVSTFDSWQPMAAYYHKDLGPPERTPPEIRRLAQDLVAADAPAREKVSAVYRYAARSMRYGRHPRESAHQTAREAKPMLDDLRGDCKDKSALMVGALRELGIPAHVAVVLTRANGEAPFLPAPRFDHAIVRAAVDGEELWMDPAGGPFTFGDLPLHDEAVAALVLDGESAETVRLPRATSDQHRIDRHARGRVEADGTVAFAAEIAAHGERAVEFRLEHVDRDDEHRARMLAQSAAADLTGAVVADARFLELDDLTRPVSCAYRLTLPVWGREIGDLLLFRVPWLHPVRSTGPLSAADRTVPLVAPGPFRVSDRLELEFPADRTGYGLPYETESACEWLRYARRIAIEAGRLVCERRVEHLGGLVPPERFGEFKRFWEECARADALDVVLVRAG
ncbi:MAG: DUF3857 domain-containing protein [Planctomycetales bacterium]